MKIENFCSTKDAVERIKRQVIFVETCTSNHISDKRLLKDWYPKYIINPKNKKIRKQINTVRKK